MSYLHLSSTWGWEYAYLDDADSSGCMYVCMYVLVVR